MSPVSASEDARDPPSLVIACGAIATELNLIIARGQLDHVVLRCLPARLHNHPRDIPGAVEEKILELRGRFNRVFVAYADCGTGGRLDEVLDRYGVSRLSGAHCYQVYAGEVFAVLHNDEPRTYYLTDFLARHFERLVWQGLGLDRHPELRDDYFGRYRRILYMSQVEDPALQTAARRAAEHLDLPFEHLHVGFGDLETALMSLADRQ